MVIRTRRRPPVLRLRSQTDEVRGSIEQVRFAAESGWCILNVKSDRGELMTVTGQAAGATPGERVRCRGQWSNHAKYGLQLEAESIETLPPATADAIEKYLASGVIAGVGPHYAKKLVRHFGTDLPQVLSQNPVYLEAVQGIGPERRQRIAESWHKHQSVREIMMFLHQHGIGPRRAAQIQRRYGERAVSVLRENPYRLAEDIHGIGFHIADRFARELGIVEENALRLDAGLRACLQEQAREGHCANVENELVRRASALLNVAEDPLRQALEKTLQARRLIREELSGQRLIFSPRLHACEIAVAAHIRRLQRGRPPWGTLPADRRIEVAESRAQKKLTASQFQAVKGALDAKLSIVTGGPGTGKTTIMKVLVDILSERLSAIHLCASTGRASRRIAQATGREAVTLHRLLRAVPGGEFGHHAQNPLEADVVIVDEATMLDLPLVCALLEALPDGAALILIGDVDQLPSVGPGQVLYDLIESSSVPVLRLTENRRQAETSAVVRNAYRVNRGLPPLPSTDPVEDFQWIIENGAERITERLVDLVCREIPARHGLDPLRDVQVLSPMRRGALGTIALNRRLQSELVPHPTKKIALGETHFGIGDRLVQLVNDAEAGVFNGDTGRLVKIDETAKTFQVDFDGQILLEYDFDEIDEVTLAFLLSVHKAQGSEYPCVVIVLSTAHYPLLSKRLLYTAITRGKRVYLLGEERAVHIALNNVRNEIRCTGLRERLVQPTLERDAGLADAVGHARVDESRPSME